MQMTSREFNQNTARAKREARKSPVYVTERGRTAFVLLTAEEYERISGPKRSIAEMFYYPGAADIDLELPERRIEPMREIDWGEID